MRRYDFDSNINISALIEERMLDVKVILHRKVLAELYLYSCSVLHKIYLVIRPVWSESAFSDYSSLFVLILNMSNLTSSIQVFVHKVIVPDFMPAHR